MSDMATVRRAVIEEWKIDRSGSADELINRALMQALVSLRPMPFTFNAGTFSLTTVADQASYAKATKGGSTTNLLPWDFWGVIGHQVRLDHGNAGSDLTALEETDPATFDLEVWQTSTSGRPVRYTVWNEKLWLNPAPDGVDGLYGRYLKDLETPTPIYSASTWNYVGANGSNIDKDTFTNDWFTRGFDVLVARVAMQYFGRFERNVKNQAAAGTAYAVALGELKREAAPLLTVGKLRPFMGG